MGKIDVNKVKVEVEDLLAESGFIPEMYMIKLIHDCVIVYFDHKEAVEYFRKDFEMSELSRNCSYEYQRDGKKHGAYIYIW